ncbi:hypothetical protein NOS3756_49050 [Nostoc sp. NIES-3756]|uniref:DUF4926 domain-containing protein n=1 Tax=Nostoc sp. NIES-3756 TaxID=1751286 RepID=UPI000721BDFC|nr:DUF4926 domain-containing protein [Nostoc sp. NIES-3756]BAT55911.1 hypothetical protein NOS3756_49050 [Nostoc sp. NIES-3756]BAY36324.1 hypothetical protein NIES2111_06500 [Nostoc sp. NIES-2111]
MSTNTLKLLDIVALTIYLPEYNLLRGQVGTIVEILADGAAFEVEFSDACGGLRLRNGQTYESVGLRPEQIMILHFEPASPSSVPEMVTA